MAYHIHHTEGIVLQTKGIGDAHVALFIYTKDMGLIIARATSLRLQRSRLRFVLQRFSIANIDLVRGKHGWLLTSARQIDINSDIYRHQNRKISYAVLTGLMLRLIQGEEANPELYSDICRMIDVLRKLESKEACFAFELLSTIRILNSLGYWDIKEGDEIYLEEKINTKEALILVFKNRKKIIPRINEALKASSL